MIVYQSTKAEFLDNTFRRDIEQVILDAYRRRVGHGVSQQAMAELGPGAHRTGDIADALGVKVNSLGPVRAKLIKKGMIYSPAHGDMAFSVPLFDEFMVRAMPR